MELTNIYKSPPLDPIVSHVSPRQIFNGQQLCYAQRQRRREHRKLITWFW